MEGFAWIFGLMGFSMGAGILAEANRLSTLVKALETRIAALEGQPGDKTDTGESLK